MNILVLSPYPPYPPHGGGTMRIYQLVRGLAQRHQVTCLTFAPDADAEAALAPLREHCRLHTVRGPAPRSTLRRAWTTVASPLPDMALRNASPAYGGALAELLGAQRFDVVQAESIEMARYLVDCRPQLAGRAAGRRPALVLDQFNAEYLLQKRAALTALAALARPPSSAAGLRASARNLAGTLYSSAQWAKLAAYERRVLRAVDAAVAVSEQDARALRRLAPEVRLAIAPNGVDTAHFSRPGLAALTFGGPTLVFSGTLDYRPNLDALAWFVAEVLPRIRAARPDVRLVAVGKRPAPELRQMAARGELVLTGEVADARPFIAGADVYVVPMRIGGGIRLKLLEALSLEAPTVSTSLGAEGVEGLRHAEHCLLADTPAAFAEAVLRLLDDREYARRLGAAGRSLVRARYDWSAIVPRLEALYSDLAGA